MLNSSSRTAVWAANRLLVTPPRSEGSGARGTEMLRCAQHDRQDSSQGSPRPLTGEVFSPNVWVFGSRLDNLRQKTYNTVS